MNIDGGYPFWLSGMVRDPQQLFDRDREKSRLRLYLTQGMSCQIVGPASIGKSSLLYNLKYFARHWDRTAKVAYLDLQDTQCGDLAGIYNKAAEEWEVREPATKPEDLSGIIKDLNKHGFRAVLCLDEFAQLSRHRHEFSIDFFLGLRALAQKGLTIFTSSRKPLNELIPSYNPTSPFFNIFVLLRIGPFSNADAITFVEAERAGVPPYADDEKAEILAFAKGHPLALQVACFSVLIAKRNGDSLANALAMAYDDMKVRLPGGW
jgi:hypothetical protein